MTDEDYRHFVETVRNHHNHYTRSLKCSTSESVKQRLWLRIIGLIETCEIVNYKANKTYETVNV